MHMRERFAQTFVLPVLVMLAAAFALLSALCVNPAQALADSYAYGVEIQAQVQANGDLKVSERRLFELDDDVNGVYWTIPFATNQQGLTSTVSIDGVSITDYAEGGEPRSFQRVDAAENGQDGVYTTSTDNEALELKVFTPHEDGDVFYATVDYTLTGAVMAWSDTAELYWQFIGPDWEDDSEIVGVLVRFDGAADSGVAALAGGNLRAWGHGPLDGSVTLDAAEPLVMLDMPRVQAGEFAEARVVFPTAWVPELAASDEARLSTILAEEKAWADEANARREQARTIVGAGSTAQVSISAIFLIIVGYLKFTRGRSPKPVFQETYFRDVPSADHPAVIAAFMENGDVPDRAFVATLMKLTDERVIALEVQTVERNGLLGTKEEEQYCLRLLNRAAATDPIDRAALQLYFGDASDGVTEVPFDQVKYRAEHDTEAYKELVDDFKAEISAQLEQRSLVQNDGGDPQGDGHRYRHRVGYRFAALLPVHGLRQSRCVCYLHLAAHSGSGGDHDVSRLLAGGRGAAREMRGAQALARGLHPFGRGGSRRRDAVEQAAGHGRCARRFRQSAARAGRCGSARRSRRLLRRLLLPHLLVVLPAWTPGLTDRFDACGAGGVGRCAGVESRHVGQRHGGGFSIGGGGGVGGGGGGTF